MTMVIMWWQQFLINLDHRLVHTIGSMLAELLANVTRVNPKEKKN